MAPAAQRRHTGADAQGVVPPGEDTGAYCVARTWLPLHVLLKEVFALLRRMPRPLRILYPGATYHIVARGDRGICSDETDRRKAHLARVVKAEMTVSLDWIGDHRQIGARCTERREIGTLAKVLPTGAKPKRLRDRIVATDDYRYWKLAI